MEGKENFIGLDYNTGRQRMELPEYGRNVMKMVEQLREIPDREKRTAQAKAVVKVMELLNPQVRQQEDYAHKLWDQLYIIAGFDLDVDAPFPIPEKAEFEKKPVPLPMKGEKIKAAHYGRNIEKIIDLLCKEPDGEIKTELIRSLALYMRQQYLIWNKDNVADETIFADLEKLSDYRIKVPEGLILSKISLDTNYARPGFGPLQPKNRNNQRRNRRRKK